MTDKITIDELIEHIEKVKWPDDIHEHGEPHRISACEEILEYIRDNRAALESPPLRFQEHPHNGNWMLVGEDGDCWFLSDAYGKLECVQIAESLGYDAEFISKDSTGGIE